MQDNKETEEIKQLKREIAKLRLEGNLRKSLSNQLTIQKKIADDAKAEALTKSEELAKISNQLAKYLSPQIHEQIFSGKQSAEVKSNRKKLTVFFSDIVNFTDISDELESEEMTNLLNFYLNEMSQIALKFGGTIDKFIGDALMIFFGDPESKGPQEDAKQCIQMALEMQDLMTQLSDYWSKNYSLKKELKIRIGINTGFCTVGNFGSLDRIDYTAIGSTVNLASRLESMSDPGSILVSEDTFALVNNFFSFEKPKEVKVKGFLRSIKCYKLQKEDTSKEDIFSIRDEVNQVSISESLERYIIELVFATRKPKDYGLNDEAYYMQFGASPRASINLNLAAKAIAFFDQRDYVLPEDIKEIASDVLNHRIILNYEAEADGITTEQIIQKLLTKIPINH